MGKDKIKLRLFLEEHIFKTPLLHFSELSRGGTSFNFYAKTSDYSVVVKLLPAINPRRVQRLCRILQVIGTAPELSTPGLVCFNEEPYFKYEQYLGLVIPFVSGHKLKNDEIKPEYMQKISTQYKKFLDFDFKQADFIGRYITAEELYRENNEKIFFLEQKPLSFFQRRTLNFLQKCNSEIYEDTTDLKQDFTVIHGDASLNNIILNQDGDMTFLDFEAIRYGYAVEDIVFLIFSILTPRLFFSHRLLKMMLEEFSRAFNFTFEEWKFAVNRYFLILLHRRLRSGKLFRSLRKDWLFTRVLKRRKTTLEEIRRLY